MKKMSMKYKKKWISCLILSGLLLEGCRSKTLDVPELIEPVSLGIETAIATRQSVHEVVYYESEVIPELTEVSFSESGMIEELNAYIGMEVKEKDRLASLAGASKEYDLLNEQFLATKENNEYNNKVQSLAIDHAKLENQLYDAKNDIDRMELLLDQQKEIQKLDEQYTKDCLSRLKSHLSDAYLSAPVEGIVAAMGNVWVGGFVSEDTPILTIANSQNQYVMCEYISELAISKCDRMYALIGDAEYELEYLPIDYSKLSAIRAKEETAYSTFKILDGKEDLVGKYAVICLVKNTREDVVTVPITSIFSDADSEYVYKMDGEGKTRVNVVTGIKGVQFVEIKEGIAEGDTVFVQESAVPNYSKTQVLDYSNLTVSTSGGALVYYPVQSEITYESEYGPATYVDWLVSKGDEVVKGQPIMTIAIDVDEIAMKELELKIDRIKKENKELEDFYKDAIKTKKAEVEGADKEQKKLLQNELDMLELESERAISDAKDYLDLVKDSLSTAEDAKEMTQILAPCDGTVFQLESYRKDDLIYPDSIVGWLYDKEEVVYSFKDTAAVLRYGQKVNLKDMRGAEYQGVVVSSNTAGLDGSMLRPEAILKSMDELTESNRYGLEVCYDVIDLEHVLVVPADAMYTDSYGSYVIELFENGTRRRYFTPGKSVNGACLVIDGLEAGMVLVTE